MCEGAVIRTSLSELIRHWVNDPMFITEINRISGLVTGMSIRKSGLLQLDCLLEQALAPDLLCRLEQTLEQRLGIREVILCQRFARPMETEAANHYAASMAPWLLRHLWKRDALSASMLRQASFHGNAEQVEIHLSEVSCSLLDPLQLDYLSQLCGDYMTGETRFCLVPAAADMRRYAHDMSQTHDQRANQIHAAMMAEPAAAPLPAASGPSAGSDDRPAQEKVRSYWSQTRQEDMIWGRLRKQLLPTPISELNSESGLVLIEGQVIRLESRTVSQGTRSLIKFDLTDYISSITCIVFAKPEEEAELSGRLNKAWVRVQAEISFDSQFAKDLQARALGIQKADQPAKRRDNAVERRVELHAHTKMSTRDAVGSASDLVQLAASFGHQAIAITDHGVVQSFPEAAETRRKLAADGQPIKLIYGMEGYLTDDGPSVVWQADNASLDDGFIALDVETTGLDPAVDRLIEVAAVHFEPDGRGGFTPADRRVSLLNPGIPVSPRSEELTGIRTEMLRDAPAPFEWLRDLADWMGERPVVAHNAFFDLSFIRHEGFRTAQPADPRGNFNPPLIDTLALSRWLLPDIKNHKLNTVSEHLEIDLSRHHRAEADALACGEIFARLWQQSGAETLQELNLKAGHATDEMILEHRRPVYHIILLAADPVGLYHLYRLVSQSHTRYFHTRPRIPRSLLEYFRPGLIVGSACEAGELFRHVVEHYKAAGCDYDRALAGLARSPLTRMARFYDYLEIQPISNNRFLLRDPDSGLEREEDLQNLNRLVVALGKKTRRPVCATCDVHFLDDRDSRLREILMTDMGFADAKEQAGLFYRTTDEMLSEFAYLGDEEARQVVIRQPAAIAERVSADLLPFPDGSFPPLIATAADDVRRLTWDTAMALYGRDGQLPDQVRERVEHELKSIIDNGYAVMYYISHKLVRKSNEDGYIVGSRGSVGSSLVASFCGITEVNPLPPHYICPDCHYSQFDQTGSYGSGYDLPARSCPECGAALHRDGQDIPFETFLGFEGDKQPDIDLNFSGEYQATAHRFIESMFGSRYTFRAGTISSYAEKNAQAIVRGFYEKSGEFVTQAEIIRLADGLIGVKRTTGQHPGGIVVVPQEREIYDFTPIQHPADKREAGTVTTHFDFNAMHDTILKLDILGHDDPTVLKMLSDLTGVDVLNIPIPDEKVMSLFQSTEALGIPEGQSPAGSATLGLPEMGTFMARDMIRETRPTRFYDLVQLMGLSHGTDVWKGNAQDLIRNGTCTINEVIGCRDSIMTGLIYNGLPPKDAFTIMERVRKGRGLLQEQEDLMRRHGVPEWYIDSCLKIRYMFPKAHAAAYTISSLRVAWFKVYYPAEYYCAFFTVRADEFDSSRMCRPAEQVRRERETLQAGFRELTDREQKIFYILELVEEMQLRGIDFLPIDLYESAASQFLKGDEHSIRPPLNAIPSISGAMAQSLVTARRDGPFKSKDELMRRTGIGQSAVETLSAAGVLDGLPDSAQMDLFEWLG